MKTSRCSSSGGDGAVNLNFRRARLGENRQGVRASFRITRFPICQIPGNTQHEQLRLSFIVATHNDYGDDVGDEDDENGDMGRIRKRSRIHTMTRALLRKIRTRILYGYKHAHAFIYMHTNTCSFHDKVSYFPHFSSTHRNTTRDLLICMKIDIIDINETCSITFPLFLVFAIYCHYHHYHCDHHHHHHHTETRLISYDRVPMQSNRFIYLSGELLFFFIVSLFRHRFAAT